MNASTQAPTRMRWKLLGLLFFTSFVAYFLRSNVSIAAKFIMPEYGLDEVAMGWVFSSFVWGYALFQLPGGVYGDVQGPRRALAVIAILWAALTVLTPLAPAAAAVLGSGGALGGFIAVRFLMGVVQAPVFPVSAGAIERWFPVSGWALPEGLLSTGLGLGAAATPPLVAWIMVHLGWQTSFYLAAPAGLLAAGLWWRYSRDDPADHPSVNAAELALIQANRPADSDHAPVPGIWKELLRDRDTLALSLSYLCMNYVFYIFFTWFYIYLVDVRGFSLLEGGFAASVPFLVGSVAASVGGWTCDFACRRIGPRWGCRLPGMSGMLAVALLLLAGAASEDAVVALALLSLCFAATQFTEGAYWSAAIHIAGPHSSAATGVLNTGGNFGGVLSTPIIPIVVASFGWLPALATGSVMAVLGAGLWLLVRADRRFQSICS